MESLIFQELKEGGSKTSTQMSKATGYAVNSISSKLSKMVRAGQIQEVREKRADGSEIHKYFMEAP